MRLYQYRYKDGVMRGANPSNENRQQVGVLAQELREILPDAVHETVSLLKYKSLTISLVIGGDVLCPRCRTQMYHCPMEAQFQNS